MRTLALVWLLALAGCTGAQPSTKPMAPSRVVGPGMDATVFIQPDVGRSSVTVTASRDSAWGALIAAYQALDIPITAIDQAGGYLGNPQFEASGRLGVTPLANYFDCGSDITGDIAAHGRLRIGVITKLEPQGEGKLAVQTQAQAVGRPQGGTSTGFAPCHSTGRLEGRIATLVKQALTSSHE